MSFLDLIRVLVIAGNTVLFAYLAFDLLSRASRPSSRGLRRIRLASGAACAAVSLGGLQRLLLQAIHLDAISPSFLDFVLEDQALIQSLLVGALGIYAWRSLRRVETDVKTAESLLAAFGTEIGEVDWSEVNLTRRQEEVLRLVGRGVVNDAQLADELGVSTETVRSHVKAVMKKVGVSSRIELAVAIHRRPIPASEHPLHPSG